MNPEQRRFWVAVRRCLLTLARLIKTGPMTWLSEEGESAKDAKGEGADGQG